MKAEFNTKSGLMHLVPEKPIEQKFLVFLFEKNISFSKSSLHFIGNHVKHLSFKINNGNGVKG